MTDEEKIPSIGDRRHGSILVCMGDDRPDQWAPWLESLVDEFEKLETTADELDLKLRTTSPRKALAGWREFCEALGVSVSSDYWEGTMISGYFQMGWIKAGGILGAKKTGKFILQQLRGSLLRQLREVRIKELKEMKDLDSLIDRTRDDRASLLTQIVKLKASLSAGQKSVSTVEQALAEAKANDTSAMTLDCLRIACAVLNGERTTFIAGPLVLWSDGVVYGFTSRGGVALPTDTAPTILLRELQRSGHPTIEVGEMTVIGGGLSGPHYRRGTAHISGWVNVWRETENNRERKFVVADPSRLLTVRAIHDHFKTPALSMDQAHA